jgi:putative peptidoglycan lipid II flippase
MVDLIALMPTSALTAASMVLGLMREMICASLFGAGRQMDLFLFGFSLYDILLPVTRDVPSGVQGYLQGVRRRRIRGVVRFVLRVGLCFGVFISLVGVAWFLLLRDPKLDSATDRATWAAGVIIISVSTVLMMAHASLSSVHIFRGNVKFQLLQPVWLNLGLIAATVLFGARFGMAALAVGVLLGTVALLVHEYVALRRADRVLFKGPVPSEPAFDGGLVATIALVAVQAFGSKASVLVERAVGITLHPGALAQLNYGIRVWGIPINLFVLAVTLPMVPSVSRARGAGDLRGAYEAFSRTMLWVLALVLAVNVLLWCFSDQIIRLLFQRGSFSGQDTESVSHLLTVLLFGGFGAAMATVSARVLWIFNRASAMAIITWGSVGLYFVVALPLVRAYGVTGLAVGNVIHYNVQAIMCALALRRVFAQMPAPRA